MTSFEDAHSSSYQCAGDRQPFQPRSGLRRLAIYRLSVLTKTIDAGQCTA